MPLQQTYQLFIVIYYWKANKAVEVTQKKLTARYLNYTDDT